MLFERTHREAEINLDTQIVYSVKSPEGQIHPTGVGITVDARTEWLPIIRAYPEEYPYGALEMLGPSRFEVDENFGENHERVVVETFPNADFSPEAFLKLAKTSIKQAANQALHDTDWMIIRQMETGVPVPDDILEKRASVRSATVEDEAELNSMAPSQWAEFVPNRTNRAARVLRD